MHDTLIINIPLQLPYVRHLGGADYGIVGDLYMYGVPTYGGIRFDPVTKKTEYYNISSPFEKLPSSFSDMAVKFYHKQKNCVPYVSLNASPKFLQGHNVYGTNYIQELAVEMIGTLKDSYPIFWQFLDIEKAYISRIDTTYFTRLEYDDLLEPLIDMIGRISVGQRKLDVKRNKFKTTRYWCKANNRVGYCKLYGKDDELNEQIKQLNRKASKGNTRADNLLTIYDDELKQFAKNLLRFEATCKKELLNLKGIPTNLWDFIRYQRKHSDVNLILWEHWFNPILNAMQGEIMTNIDDSEIRALCYDKLVYTTDKGNLSYGRAKSAYQFYVFLKSKGWKVAKDEHTRPTFYRNVKYLTDIGLSLTDLQNMNGIQHKSMPICEFIKFDFSNQTPPNYKPPKSRYHGEFDEYLKPQLRLVA